jgi:hypothetical protein
MMKMRFSSQMILMKLEFIYLAKTWNANLAAKPKKEDEQWQRL